MRNLARVLLLVCIVALFFTGVSSAEESLMLEEITVRGQQESSQQETLTIREVRESAARDMGEALESVAGMSSVNKGAIANDVVLRGLQGDDINVFLDGVRLYGGCPSRMDPPSFHFDFAEVDSIEVIKGPYDLRNAGSMGGMVNAVSKTPPDGSALKVSGTYGSHNLINLSASGSYSVDKRYLLGGYAFKKSDVPESGDGKLLTDIYPLPMPGMADRRYKPEYIDSKAYEINTFWIKGGDKIGSTDLSLNYSYQDADHVLYPYLFMDADYDRTHRVNFMSSTEFTGAVKELNLQAWWNKVEHLMNDKFRYSSDAVPGDFSMETDSTTEVYGFKLDGISDIGSGQLDAGIDYYYRNWDATNILSGPGWVQPMLPDVGTDNVGGFVEYMHPLNEQFKISGGARVDYNKVKANALDQTRLNTLYQPYQPNNTDAVSVTADFTTVSGNIQLTWFPTEGIEVFTGLASGTRTPDGQELYIGLDRPMTMPSWVGNPNLDPTRNNQVDLGVKFSGERYYLNTSVYYSDLRDFIDVARVPHNITGTPAATTYRNVDAEMYGGELAGQYALPADLYLKAILSYVRGQNQEANTPLSEIPPLNGNIALRYDLGDLFIELTERFADKQDRVDPALDEDVTPGWAVTDVKIGKTWDRWSLTGGVNNIFDKFYFSHLSYQRNPFGSGVKVAETGRLAYLTLSYNY
jgi:iron complex outermembrane receptor protein